jgi:hypothetical protein
MVTVGDLDLAGLALGGPRASGQLGGGDDVGAQLGDDQAAGQVGQVRGIGQAGARRHGQGQGRGHGVAGAGDVEHLDRRGRQMDRRRAAHRQGHARPAASDQRRFQARRHGQDRRAGVLGSLVAIVDDARGLGGFLAVGLDQGRAVIAGEVAALGIDDHRLAGRPGRVDRPAHDLGVSTPLA